MPAKNTISDTQVQQLANTTDLDFFVISRTGDAVLKVIGGTDAADVMGEVGNLLEGVWMLFDRLARSEESLDYLELGALAFMMQGVSAMQNSARRGLAKAGGDA